MSGASWDTGAGDHARPILLRDSVKSGFFGVPEADELGEFNLSTFGFVNEIDDATGAITEIVEAHPQPRNWHLIEGPPPNPDFPSIKDRRAGVMLISDYEHDFNGWHPDGDPKNPCFDDWESDQRSTRIIDYHDGKGWTALLAQHCKVIDDHLGEFTAALPMGRTIGSHGIAAAGYVWDDPKNFSGLLDTIWITRPGADTIGVGREQTPYGILSQRTDSHFDQYDGGEHGSIRFQPEVRGESLKPCPEPKYKAGLGFDATYAGEHSGIGHENGRWLPYYHCVDHPEDPHTPFQPDQPGDEPHFFAKDPNEPTKLGTGNPEVITGLDELRKLLTGTGGGTPQGGKKKTPDIVTIDLANADGSNVHSITGVIMVSNDQVAIVQINDPTNPENGATVTVSKEDIVAVTPVASATAGPGVQPAPADAPSDQAAPAQATPAAKPTPKPTPKPKPTKPVLRFDLADEDGKNVRHYTGTVMAESPTAFTIQISDPSDPNNGRIVVVGKSDLVFVTDVTPKDETLAVAVSEIPRTAPPAGKGTGRLISIPLSNDPPMTAALKDSTKGWVALSQEPTTGVSTGWIGQPDDETGTGRHWRQIVTVPPEAPVGSVAVATGDGGVVWGPSPWDSITCLETFLGVDTEHCEDHSWSLAQPDTSTFQVVKMRDRVTNVKATALQLDARTQTGSLWSAPIVSMPTDTPSGYVAVSDGSGGYSWAAQSSGGSSPPFTDASALIKSATGTNRQAIISAAGLPDSTTRTFTLPDVAGSTLWTDQGDKSGAVTNQFAQNVAGTIKGGPASANHVGNPLTVAGGDGNGAGQAAGSLSLIGGTPGAGGAAALVMVGNTGDKVSFYAGAGVTKQTITGSRAGNAAVASIAAAGATLGMWIDGTTA